MIKGRFDHLGIIVENLAESRSLMECLGFKLQSEGSLPDKSVKATFMQSERGGVRVELVRFGDKAVRDQRLNGELGKLDHVAIEVEDLDRACVALAEQGIKMQSEVALSAGPMRFKFTRPDTTLGITYQIFDYRGG